MRSRLTAALILALIVLCNSGRALADDMVQVFGVSGYFEGGSIPIFSGATISADSTITIDVTSGNVISANVLIPGYTFNSVSSRAEEGGWFYLALTSTSSSFPLLQLGLAENGPSLVGYSGNYICGFGGQDAACGNGAFVSNILVDPVARTSVLLEAGRLTPMPEPSSLLLLAFGIAGILGITSRGIRARFG